jgi:nitrogen fixation-related uncharacterized protein
MAFLWSIKTGQYDDDYSPSVRILYDDAPISKVVVQSKENNKQSKI